MPREGGCPRLPHIVDKHLAIPQPLQGVGGGGVELLRRDAIRNVHPDMQVLAFYH